MRERTDAIRGRRRTGLPHDRLRRRAYDAHVIGRPGVLLFALLLLLLLIAVGYAIGYLVGRVVL